MNHPRNDSPGSLTLCANNLSSSVEILPSTIEVVTKSSMLIFESAKHGRRVLKAAGIHREFFLLSEHTEKETLEEATANLQAGKSIFYMSDHGSSGFEDPGHQLVQIAYNHGSRISLLQCSSALTGILSVCPFKVSTFTYPGLLPRAKEQRYKRLQELRWIKHPIVLIDTPYRFLRLIENLLEHYPPSTHVVLGVNMGFAESEKYYYNTLGHIKESVKLQKKDMYTLLVEPKRD